MAKKSNSSQKSTGFSELYSKTEQFVDKNRTALTVGLLVVVVGVAGFFAYKFFIVQPRIEKSHAEKSFSDNQFFASYQASQEGLASDTALVLALNDYLAEHGDMPAAPRAALQLAIVQMERGSYQEALATLEGIEMDNEVLTPLLKANIGDCYVELGDLESAEMQFASGAQRASAGLAEHALAPMCLYKQAVVVLELGETERARELLIRIKNEYPTAEFYAKRAEALELTLPR